jgi:hypothetical protein
LIPGIGHNPSEAIVRIGPGDGRGSFVASPKIGLAQSHEVLPPPAAEEFPKFPKDQALELLKRSRSPSLPRSAVRRPTIPLPTPS